eukprot:Skav206397  [mRNA]  locus=scaffold690:123009:125401:+ [translate_table: standard]
MAATHWRCAVLLRKGRDGELCFRGVRCSGFRGQSSPPVRAMASLNQQLMDAAGSLDLQLIRDLLKQGANAQYIDEPQGQRLIHIEDREMDPEGVWGSRARNGPLHVALRKQPRNDAPEEVENWTAVVRTLVEAKADVNEAPWKE